MNYRERCYQTYVSTKWQYTHSLTKEEYNLFSKVSKKRFKGTLPEDKDARIIDVACGAGHFLYFLQNQEYTNAWGIDSSKEQLETAAKGSENLLPLLVACVENDLTLGEICAELRGVWGEYQPSTWI